MQPNKVQASVKHTTATIEAKCDISTEQCDCKMKFSCENSLSELTKTTADSDFVFNYNPQHIIRHALSC